MTSKASLMASLTGEPLEQEPEGDLFGGAPIQEEVPPPAVTPQPMPAPHPEEPSGPMQGQLIVDNPLDSQTANPLSSTTTPAQPAPQPVAPAPTQKSLLAGSALLGVTNGDGGGGLFDQVDKDEEERQMKEEHIRKEEEQKRIAEQQRLEEERRRQAEEQMMQTVNLSGSVMPQQPQPMAHMTQQVQNMSMSTPNPMSFAERSQAMQHQATYMQQHAQQHAQSQYMQQSSPMMPQQHPGMMMSQPQQQQPGFYRPEPSPMMAQQPHGQGQPQPNTFVFASTGGPVQTHSFTPMQSPTAVGNGGRLPHTPTPSVTAGMHNAIGSHIRPMQIVQPPAFTPLYGQVVVSDPLLVQPPSLFNVVPPHWTYQVQTQLEGGVWLVRRRFRHIVALEDRLRMECPGAILPARPEKHATRVIEEASTMQSADFAMQRAAEVQVYLNSVVLHPIAGKSSSIKLFLALQDDMGTAWPEVSSNALTRLGAVSGAAVQNVSDTNMPWDSNTPDALEDDAQLLALTSSEGVRMGAVTQAVPKLEGAVTLMREHGESAGAVGMELGKLSKAVEGSDRDLAVPIEILSNGLLRYGRRQKRLALELSAAMNTFVNQHKICKNEKMAFQDRRTSLQKRVKERGRADIRAQQLMIQQRNFQPHGVVGGLDRLERDASMSDQVAVNALHHCDIIANTIKSEVNRVAYERRTEWNKSMKVLCASLKEATTEEKAIWESTKDSFIQNFPEYNVGDSPAPAPTTPSPGAAP